jgi:hypothetical protein
MHPHRETGNSYPRRYFMKISTKMMKGILSFIGMLFLLAPLTVFAQDDLMMMITPALSGNRPLRNVITVAKGNGKFTDPVAAVNSITDASETNPYLVVIGPGVYTIMQTLVMKPYVDIAGSGENITKITGAISGMIALISAIITGTTSYAVLRSLTVENLGGGITSVALYNGGPQTVSDVTAIARGGTGNNTAVFNSSFGGPVMKNVTARAYPGAKYSYGVYNNNTSPMMIGVTANAGGENSYGVYNYNLSSPVIGHSTMNGSKNGLYSDHISAARVSQSTIIGGVGGAGTNTCVACDNGSGKALDGNCVVIP